MTAMPSHRVVGGVLLALLMLIAPTLLPARASPPPDVPIRLRFATFDPLGGAPSTQAMATEEGMTTWLVQFDGPVQASWKAAVEQTGANLYGYIPDYAFISRMDAANAEKVRALPHVRWVGSFQPAYRLAPELGEVAARDSVSGEAGAVTITVQTLPDIDLDGLAGRVESWGGQVEDQAQNPLAGYLRLTLPSDRLTDLASLDGVLWVEPYFEPQLHNDVGGGIIMRAAEIRSNLGLYGNGQIVGVADSGLDLGTTGPQMSDDFEGRIVEGQAICAYFQGGRTTWNDFDGHGTHVSGSVLGNGVLSGSNPTSHQYSGSFAGVAPEAQLVFQSIDHQPGGALECIPADLTTYIFGPAHDLGARVHTNSWGGPTGGTAQEPEYGGYTTGSQAADQAAWTYKDMLILYSAGNSGVDGDADGVVDPDSIGSPGTAKDVLTVGASENLRPSFTTRWGDGWATSFPVDPIFGDRVADNDDGMAAFSSRGPTDDGRIKPDIVAPGTFIISARSHDPEAGEGWGVYDDHYLYMGGTSMSTPLTAGAAALVREWLTGQQGVSNPSGALMKAVLLNGAANMSPGQYGSGSTQEVPAARPNPVTGWGRGDLVESLDPAAPRQIWLEDNTSGLNTGSTAVYTLTVGSTATSVRQAPPPTATPGPPRAAGRPVARLTGQTPGQAPAFVGAGGHRPLGTSQLLQNEGFEAGDWSPWETYGSPYLTSIIKHTGSRSAHAGDSNNADDEFWQEVDIPADASDVTTDFWFRLRTDEIGRNVDYFCYGIWHESGFPAYVLRCADFGETRDVDWSRETYSLDAGELADVVGQTVLFGFLVQTDSSLTSRAWVDDTALYVTTPDTTPTPTNTPTPTPTDTPTPTPTATDIPPACPEAVADGGFEQATGDSSHPNWSVSGNARFTVNQGIAHTGQDAAILGYTSSPASGELWQAVAVSADASSASLSFWYQTLGDGSFSVSVDVTDNSGGSVLAHLVDLNSAGFGWQQYSHSFTAAELAAVTGQNVRLRFRISGVSDPEDVVIDDVSWTICTDGTPTLCGPFHLTLAWTDYPGEPAAAKALVNDLDLEVIAPDGTRYYGNQGLYSGGQCLRSNKWDACNNVEGIRLAAATCGTYTVIVHGYNVPQGPQPYALVASGDNLLGTGGPSWVYLPLVIRNQ